MATKKRSAPVRQASASPPSPLREAAKAKAPLLGKCCPVLDLVLTRDTSKQVPLGFEIATPFGLSDGKPRSPVIIYRFRKAARVKKGDSISEEQRQLQDVSYAACAYCPFCGTKLERVA